MNVNGCIAMILAGGRGERLGALTHYCSKPIVHFGGKHRIIDFTLNNCHNSGINTIGILSQYFSNDLHAYITCDRKTKDSGIYMLPSKNNEDYYMGTADAVYKNIGFIERFNPDCVLVLAGDHIYNMDYRDLISFHWKNNADVTLASTPVPPQEASRFGMIHADGNGRVWHFEEKPRRSISDLASMGIYVFKWDKLKKYLLMNSKNQQTRHDFSMDILPGMLDAGESMYTYRFDDYWRDVGTVDSLWEANMNQIGRPKTFPSQSSFRVGDTPHCMGSGAIVRQSIVSEGDSIFGRVEHSVLGDFVTVDKGAEVVDSVIMPGAYIGAGAKIHKAIVGTKAVIMDNTVIGTKHGSDFFVDGKICAKGISLVAPWLYIGEGMSFRAGSHIYEERLQEWAASANAAGAASKPYLCRAEKTRRDNAIHQALSV